MLYSEASKSSYEAIFDFDLLYGIELKLKKEIKTKVKMNNFIRICNTVGIKLSPSYTVTFLAPIHHDSSRFETDGKIGLHRDASGWKKRNSSINTMSHDSSTDPLRLKTAGLRFTTVELRMLTMPPQFDTVLVRFKPVGLR